jgi:putative transposase
MEDKLTNYQSLSHVRWDCKYRGDGAKVSKENDLRAASQRNGINSTGVVFKQKGVEVLEGHAMPDHVHVCVSIPPKHSVSSILGFVKGKSAIQIHRQYFGKNKNFTGFHFWSRGYWVSTVGLDEEMIKAYIRNQEVEDRREEASQMGLFQPPLGGQGGK